MAESPTTPWFAAAFGAHYPVLYAHRDEAEAARCLDLLPRLAPLGDRVLDLGCGDGRHLIRLAEEAWACGLDYSAALLQAARGRVDLSAPLVRGDMRHLPWGDTAFTAVLNLFTAFGYFGRESDAAVVAGVGRVLVPGGHWFLDYFDSDAVRAELAGGEPHKRRRRAGPLDVSEVRRWCAEPPRVLKTVRLEAAPDAESAALASGVGPDGLEYTEQVGVYSLAELDAMAAAAGLDRVAAAGDYDGGGLGCGDRWILVYRKEGGVSG